MIERISKVVLGSMLAMSTAWAAQVTDFVPDGQVSQIESVQASFDEAMVPFGSAQLPAPFNIECNDAKASGAGRWLDAQRWTYVFDRALDAGVRCSATLAPDFRTLKNEAIQGQGAFEFSTGGPRLVRHRPYGPVINEDQVFVLNFNGPVEADSLLASSHCTVGELGEEIPLRLITGPQRTQILATLYEPDFADTDATQLVQCKRRLPADTAVELAVGPGLSTIPVNGYSARNDKRESLRYEVRPPFTASLSCQRENSHSPCLPVSSIAVQFSSNISREDAAKIRLQLPESQLLPDLSDWEGSSTVSRVKFGGPFPANASLSVVLPEGLRDEAGRELINAESFPLAFQTAAFPPLVKFASDSFGVVERFAAVPPGGKEDDFPATVPLSLRHVEAELLTKELAISSGTVNDHVTQDDRQALRWYARMRRLQQGQRTPGQIRAILSDQKMDYGDRSPAVDVRGVSVLAGQPDVRSLVLPGTDAQHLRPFEVIGVPVPEPGLHVLEVESSELGRSLLGEPRPMYVRTLALVTNLGVHLKRGRDDALVWVTTLDTGDVVPDAQINVLDCTGRLMTQGRTDAEGLWHHRGALSGPEYCEETGLSGVFVSARIPADHIQARGRADFSFVMSQWDDGIEAWRFNVPTDSDSDPTRVVHTVLDRTLFRAGETVSMKHYLRVQTRDGLDADIDGSLPDKLVISHQGSDDTRELDVTWHRTQTGGLSAHSAFPIPEAARLGTYSAYLTDKDNRWYGQTTFRVEAFKLPVFSGSIQVRTEPDSTVLVAPDSIDVDVQLSYIAGGPASRLPVSLSAVSEGQWPHFQGYPDYSFRPPEPEGSEADAAAGRGGSSGESAPHVFLNKRPLALDGQGGARLAIDQLPTASYAKRWLFEASFADPNGEIQTLAHSVSVWPAKVQAGVSAKGWGKAGDKLPVKVIAVTPQAQAQASVPVRVEAFKHITYSTRKRLVGGFYSYDNQRETRSLGTVCEGRTGNDGVLECAVHLSERGSIELVAIVTDDNGRRSSAATSVWVSGEQGLWFGGHDDDRMDVIPAREDWKPGEVAEFQVRMPFQSATALVSVEREGVLHTQVQQLDSSDPTIRLPIRPEWGPNVYVSVLALRPRLRELPWKALTTIDWSAPDTWYDTLQGVARLMAGPTTQIDLAKPSFRFGLASIRISDETDRLDVRVSADRSRYQVADEAMVEVQVTTADGKPAAHGTVAFAAVDEALLELSPNASWNLLDAMRQERSYGVRTATAQMQIVGRRHYGRKALPAGGGGGKSPTRELLDTLLLWLPVVELDEQGRASIPVQLNDAITRFRLVAVADHGATRFGTGSTVITSTRDLQIVSGLPQMVRQGDHYEARITVRNATDRDMDMSLSVEPTTELFAAQHFDAIHLPAGDAHTVSWPVQIPISEELPSELTLRWRMTAEERKADGSPGEAIDRVSIPQTVIPVAPVRVQQSTTVEISPDAPVSISLAPPRGALKADDGAVMGGVRLFATAGPAINLDSVTEWFEQYSYSWLEQMASRAIATGDQEQWAELMSALPAYLDNEGLARQFPGPSQGSEVLTAWLLMISDEARALGWEFQLPDTSRDTMLRGLRAFVEGRLSRNPAGDVDRDVRKLIALDALSRYGRMQPRMLDSLQMTPDQWPTSALIDWLGVLQRETEVPGRQTQMEQARQILKARLLARGTTRVFADNDLNKSAWLMVSRQSNQARLILATLNSPQWDDDRIGLIQGLIGMQVRGTWETSTANLLGSFAINAFIQRNDFGAVNGVLHVGTGSGKAIVDLPWRHGRPAHGVNSVEALLPWAEFQARGEADDGSASMVIAQRGDGRPWLTVSALAAVTPEQAVSSGFTISRQMEAITQTGQGRWTVGDVYRVRIAVDARAPAPWVVVEDAIPAGARILGGGLGRDSHIDILPDPAASGHASQSSSADPSSGWVHDPTFVERRSEGYRAYFDYLPAGQTVLEYVVRLNTAGTFLLPATRVESAYEPDVYGELPVTEALTVEDKEP